jgi:hypothetical protein
VPWHGFNSASRGVEPEGVRSPLSLENAPVLPEMSEKGVPLHAYTRSGSTTNVYGDGLPLCIGGYPTESILSAILKDQLDRLDQALPGLILCAALSIRSRNFRTIGNYPVPILFEYGRKLVAHDPPTSRASPATQNLSHRSS